MKISEKHKVVLVDDHTLIRKGLVELVNKNDNYTVVWEAGDGREFIDKLKVEARPEIVILDISMQIMDGYETAKFLRINYPEIKVLVVSMFDQDDSIMKMLEIGVDGYILKDAEPAEFKMALDKIIEKGFYYSEKVTGIMAGNIKAYNKYASTKDLCSREIEFLEYIGTDMTYKDIAEKMELSVRTVEGYRDDLFIKLKIRSRQKLVVYAIKNGIIRV